MFAYASGVIVDSDLLREVPFFFRAFMFAYKPTGPPSLYCVKSVLSRRFLILPTGILLGIAPGILLFFIAPIPREDLILVSS